MKVYVATFHGDLEHSPMVANSLSELLSDIKEKHGYGQTSESYVYEGEMIHEYKTPDPEDDKIEIWEYDNEAKTARIVWGFWGWHWQIPEGLVQGTMPGNDKPLYVLAEE